MSTYTKTTNFTAKDNLTSGDPAKVIKGSEFDTEFNSIETSVNSKADANNGTHTGTTTISTANIDTLQVDGVEVTATPAELNTLDGITSTTAELNKLDGFSGDYNDLNYAKDLRATGVTAAEFDTLDGLTATTAELNTLDGITSTTTELNFVDGVTSNIQTQLNNKQPLDAQLTDVAGLTPADGSFIVGNGTNFVAESGNTAIASLGVTATAAELNTLDGITATTAELNTLDGITASTLELNYTDGVTSNIQTQLNGKATTAQGALADSAVQPNDNVSFGTGDFSGVVTVTSTITADEVDVIGTITANAANVTGTVNTNGLASNGDITVGAGQKFKFNDQRYFTPENNVDGAEVSANGKFTVKTGATPSKSLVVGATGDVSFYEDTGTTAKMVWSSGTERLGIGESNPDTSLDVVGGSANSVVNTLTLKNDNTGVSAGVGVNFVVDGVNDVPISAIYGQRTGASYHQGSLQFLTNDNAGGGLLERMRIDSAGNVAMGTEHTPNALNIYKSGGTTVNISAGSNDAGTKTRLGLGSYVYNGGGGSAIQAETYHAGTSATTLEFFTSGGEKARIDSQGNLLVGKTIVNNNNVGIEAKPNGSFSAVADNITPILIRRKTGDGTLLALAKDSTTTGTIGIRDSYPYLAKPGQAGIRIENLDITPCDSSGGALNNFVDLGNSGNAFKDLYLSGGTAEGYVARKSQRSVTSSVSTTHYIATSQTEWQPFYIYIKVASGRTGLQENQASWYLYKGQSFNRAITSIVLVDSGGNTGNFSISITSVTSPSNAVVTIQATDAGTDRTVISTEIGAYANQVMS